MSSKPNEGTDWVTTPDYSGPERRTSALSTLLEDIRALNPTLELLAERLPTVASAQQVEARAADFVRLVKVVGSMFVGLFVLQFIVSVLFVIHIDGKIDSGHNQLLTTEQVTNCLLGLTEAVRTTTPAQSLITCRQSVEGSK